MSFIHKIRKRIDRIRFKPIDVYVFHSVSPTFDPWCCVEQDWCSTQNFKDAIMKIKESCDFISLPEAYRKLKHNVFRLKRYAVLTCDDGFVSALSVLPFVVEQGIPMTLFINAKYLDGKSVREGYSECPQYIDADQLNSIRSDLITVGMHGYEHVDCTCLSASDFARSVERCVNILESHPRFIPYYAYTWGRWNDTTQGVLKRMNLIPVLCDGATNYRYSHGISRLCLV